MMHSGLRKGIMLLVLGCLLAALSGCKENPPAEKLNARLMGYFADCGFQCSIEPLETEREVPIYNSSVWQRLLLDGEEVLLYFDESNRADYLTQGISPDAYSFAGHFGLRFVLVYEGENPQVLKALEEMPEV